MENHVIIAITTFYIYFSETLGGKPTYSIMHSYNLTEEMSVGASKELPGSAAIEAPLQSDSSNVKRT